MLSLNLYILKVCVVTLCTFCVVTIHAYNQTQIGRPCIVPLLLYCCCVYLERSCGTNLLKLGPGLNLYNSVLLYLTITSLTHIYAHPKKGMHHRKTIPINPFGYTILSPSHTNRNHCGRLHRTGGAIGNTYEGEARSGIRRPSGGIVSLSILR
jgi:hypothetical protein